MRQHRVLDGVQKDLIDALDSTQLIVWLEKASLVERLARGQPTSIVNTTDASNAPDLSRLSDAELVTLQTLLEKAGA